MSTNILICCDNLIDDQSCFSNFCLSLTALFSMKFYLLFSNFVLNFLYFLYFVTCRANLIICGFCICEFIYLLKCFCNPEDQYSWCFCSHLQTCAYTVMKPCITFLFHFSYHKRLFLLGFSNFCAFFW